MRIDGRTKVCGLIGNPVEHTLSPLIHNMLAAAMGQNFVYVPFLTVGGRAEVETAVAGAYALHVAGLNVTVPHKEQVLCTLCETDPLAKRIGAVNTLVRTPVGYKGYNTDMTGLYRAMMREKIALQGEDVIVLGAGGAARAVAFMLVHYGAKRVYLLNRTLEKAACVAREINEDAGRACILPLRLSEYRKLPQGRFLAIQATSVGLAPDCEAAVIGETDFYQKIHTGYDLIYRPTETRFMRLVRENGGRAFNGLTMLLYQGIDAYELWNGVQVEDTLAGRVYENMKREMDGNA